MKKSLGLGTRQSQAVPQEGLPEGLNYEVLADLCLQHTGGSLKKVSYVHLSGWKRAGAHRVFLEDYRGRKWRLIYKNAIYDLDQIPALHSFPIKPGLPEFLVYSHARGALAEFLPDVYLCTEKIPDVHYQYLLEDLGAEFVRISGSHRSAKSKVAAKLPVFHEAMRRWLSEVDQDRLLRYDFEYSEALQRYAGAAFTRLARSTSSHLVREVCDLWSNISETYLAPEFSDLGRNDPVHGDLNVANVLVHKSNPAKFKLIDWEWAGFGVPYADLVSLFRRADPARSVKILAFYAANIIGRDPDEAARIYEWCRLERGILDAAFMAAQHSGSAEATPVLQQSITPFIKEALETTLASYRALAR